MAKAKTNNRWWEFYFVRYFVGTVIGFGVIYILNSHPDSTLLGKILPGMEKLNKISGLHYSVLAALGLAYCYIASAPILVLHACRSAFLVKSRNYVKGEMSRNIFIALIIIFFIGILSFNYFTGNLFQKIAGFLVASFTVFQIILLIIFSVRNNVVSYYSELCGKRAEDNNIIKEYSESYRHLREHGNAFLILILELILALCLFSVKKPTDAIIVIFLWVIPSCSVWFIGSYLESKIIQIQSNKEMKPDD